MGRSLNGIENVAQQAVVFLHKAIECFDGRVVTRADIVEQGGFLAHFVIERARAIPHGGGQMATGLLSFSKA